MDTLLMIAAGLMGLTLGGMILLKLFWYSVELMWYFATEISTWLVVGVIIMIYVSITNPVLFDQMIGAFK
jgi:hypothetical protein